MSISDKLTTIANNMQLVYEKGKSDELDEFWENLQDGGNRSNYSRGFAGWTSKMLKYFTPKYDIVPSNAYMIFGQNKAITDLVALLNNFDIALDFSKCTVFQYILHSSSITHIGVIDTTSADSLSNMFDSASLLETIDKLILKDNGSQSVSNIFRICNSLKNLIIEGTIGDNIDLSSTKLTPNSIASVINALSNTTTGKTLRIKTEIKTNYDTANGSGAFDTLIATKSNWTVTLI